MKHYSALLILFTIAFTHQIQPNITDRFKGRLLSFLQKYTHMHPEHPQSDNENWIDPDYTAFHKSLTPGFIRRILYKTGIQRPSWDPLFFKYLLKEIGTYRTTQKLSGQQVVRITAKPDSKFFVWGDIHGAFHSLIRCLVQLHQEGIIDENLTIIKPNHYFVFNGDCINRSPYTLETLTVILLLTKQNPDNFFYIRGKHEDKNYWHNFGLKRELLLRAHSVSQEFIPLNSLVNTFFNTLPLALYISTPDKPNHVIRISHVDRSQLDESQFGTLFTNTSEKAIRYYETKKKLRSPVKIDVKAIIKTENWMKDQLTQKGLGMPEQDKGSTSWTVLSSPIKVHQVFSNFFYDAYAVIEIKQPIEKSTITLRHQNVKQLDGFKTYATYNIVTGINKTSPAYGTTKEPPLMIGSSMALLQGVPIMGQRLKRGMSVRINNQNINGGVNSHHIRTLVYNDNYIPNLAKNNIQTLLNQNIDTILLPIGSPTLKSYLNAIRSKKIAVFFPVTGSSSFRTPELKNIVHFRTTYADEVKALVNHLVTEYGTSKFAFFYQDDFYGQSPLKAAHQALKKHGITSWTDIPYTRAAIDLSSQAQKIKEAQPDVIGLFSTAHATQELIRQLGIEPLANKKLFGISFLGEESFRRFIKKSGLEVLFGAVVPNPHISNLPIVQEYRKAMDIYHYQYDVFSLEAYIATSILLDAIQKISGTITKEKILQQLESLNNYKFKGLTLTFNPKNRDLSPLVWLEMGKDKPWISKKINHHPTKGHLHE